MKYELYLFGKKNSKSYHKKAIDEYMKRLSRYCKISCTIIGKQKEWEKAWAEHDQKVLVLPGKESVSSEEFSRMLGSFEMSGNSKLAYFIPDIITQKDWCEIVIRDKKDIHILNLSDLSMGTGLCGVVLAEQIYRGYRILNNHPYHK
ncbi:MAG: 23S rRNA (pseudouridine(1915)-N(3))-methyltransferase RlmH [Eubacterium sp.]|nr:23S rRNA (pseudouridine(1915)-N(3))-methyltransferase RlmH [Eubacterium sp.]